MKFSPLVCASFVILAASALTANGASAQEGTSAEKPAPANADNMAVTPGRKTCESKGLTWDRAAVNTPTGTVSVSCHGNVGGYDCGAYHGDTLCGKPLAILCIKKDAAYFPKPASVNNSNRYNMWASGVVGTTKEVVPCRQARTLKEANSICQAEFGSGWGVAEHHNGWGWGFQAYGNVGDPSKRFWMDITDQPDATCWTR
jgi:hypothetical protein